MSLGGNPAVMATQALVSVRLFGDFKCFFLKVVIVKGETVAGQTWS